MFVAGVEYGFLCVHNVMLELFEGVYFNIVVIVASVMLSLLIHFCFVLYIAIVKRVVLSFVNLYKSPLL